MIEFSAPTGLLSDKLALRKKIFANGVSAAALSAALLAASTGATAQDTVEIADERTEPVRTSEIIGPGEGTLVIAEGGSITSSLTPLIIDGPHRLEIIGLLSNTASADAIGVLVDTSDLTLLSDIEFTGDIQMLGADPENVTIADQSNLTGIRFEGAGGFNGVIGLRSSSRISIAGLDSTGVSIATDVTGGIALNGQIDVQGSGGRVAELLGDLSGNFTANGTLLARSTDGQILFVDGDISGRMTLGGVFESGSVAPLVDDTLVNSRDAVVLNGNIGGGILFEGAGQNNTVTDEDGNVTPTDGQIIANGGGSAVVIENTRPADGTLTIGQLSEGLGYSIINRNFIGSQSTDVGLDVTAVRIGGGIGGAVDVESGILLDTGSIVSSAVDGQSVGIRFGAGASVSRFDLAGTGAGVTASTSIVVQTIDGESVSGPGGDAIAVLIEEGATLASINNAGDLGALAAGAETRATAILDLSGSLLEVINSGDIQALSASESTLSPIAIDVRANTAGFRLENTGDIVGDLYFGSGSDTLEIDGGNINGNVDFGTGDDNLILSNGASILGGVDFSESLSITSLGSVVGLQNGTELRATNITIGSDSVLIAQVDPVAGTSGRLLISEQLSFAADTSISVDLLSFSVAEQEFIIADANTILGADVSEFSLREDRFLYNTSFSTRDLDGREQLVLSLTPRTSEELGLSRQFGQVYENIQQGLEPSELVEVALANLSSAEEVEQALADIAPDFTNRLFEATMSNQRILNRNFSERLDDFLGGTKNPGGTWAVEHGAIGEIDSENAIFSSNYTNFGLSVGYTGRFSEGLAAGVGIGFSLFGAETDSGFGTDISVFAPFVTTYVLANYGFLYGGISGTATYLDVERDRRLDFVDGAPLIESSSDGLALSATAELGLDIDIGSLNIKPYGQLTAYNLSENGYRELGGSGAQEIGDRDLNFVEGTGGISLSYDFVLEKTRYSERILRPEIYGGMSRFVSGERRTSFDARFLESDQSLRIDGDLINANTEFAGAAISLFGQGSTARIRYQYEDRGMMTTHSATLNFKLVF